ncbi:hypothetical protein K469DRAFT_698497 [Zopfia rhizophila CBS 207.26]|uniref:Uncharacterized protein n=1 Tax=Zopfia rhizophila CBS 207.26 TaxID=1314779 RepID=A0A6A6EVY0_9PEZI|nr:hypothetical protein K469DRAFT_698497 [Zopfia rhizophila CBS 207.26]
MDSTLWHHEWYHICGIVWIFQKPCLAVVSRAIGWLLSLNVGVIQNCVGKLVTRKEQPRSVLTIDAPILMS